MKILFYNINDGRCDREGVLKYLDDLKNDYDVLCLQEVKFRIVDAVKNLFNDFSFRNVNKSPAENAEFGQFTIIKPIHKFIQEFEILKEYPHIGVGLYTKVSINNKIINLINFHGLPKPGDKLDTPERFQQSKGLIDFLDNIEGPKIIGGDFNYHNDIEAVKIFEKSGYVDLIKKYDIKTTRNENIWRKYPESKQYYSDFVFVSPEINIKKFEVPYNEYSDHLPLLLEVDF